MDTFYSNLLSSIQLRRACSVPVHCRSFHRTLLLFSPLCYWKLVSLLFSQTLFTSSNSTLGTVLMKLWDGLECSTSHPVSEVWQPNSWPPVYTRTSMVHKAYRVGDGCTSSQVSSQSPSSYLDMPHSPARQIMLDVGWSAKKSSALLENVSPSLEEKNPWESNGSFHPLRDLWGIGISGFWSRGTCYGWRASVIWHRELLLSGWKVSRNTRWYRSTTTLWVPRNLTAHVTKY